MMVITPLLFLWIVIVLIIVVIFLLVEQSAPGVGDLAILTLLGPLDSYQVHHVDY